jgi:DNA topoisomerase-1
MPTQLKKRNGHLNIYRTKKRKTFLYLNSIGGRIKDINTLNRISQLKIPPAYNEVKISSQANHKLQATGIDDKGRLQYIYNSKHLEKRHKLKFKELINFGLKIEKIRKDTMHKIKDDDSVHSKSKIIALIIYLLDNCLFRIGNKFYTKRYNTYGITTLKPKHFYYKGNVIYIEFVGKKNVVNYCQVNNKYVTPLLKKLVQNAGKNNNVFRYQNNSGNFTEISAMEVNKFLKSYYNKLSVKMFRTWAANYIFLEETVKDLRQKPDLTESVTDIYAKKHVVNTLKTIATKLHNTPTVSKKSYMNNEILNIYLQQPTKFYKKAKSGQREDLNKLLLELLDTAT